MIIPEFTRYDISEDGVVTDLKNNKEVSVYTSQAKGRCYRVVNLTDNYGYKTNVTVASLLARTYLEKPEGNCVVRMKDGNYNNTILSNIEWVSRSQLMQDVLRKGAKRGGRPPVPVDDAATMVYDTLHVLDEPARIVDLSLTLQVPYPVVRRAVDKLRKDGKVVKVEHGFVVAER